LTELENAQTEIQTAILSEELQKPELTREHIVYWITRFRDIDLNDLNSRKRLIDSFVNTIYLYDDKLMFVFNYKDGTKTVTFAELECSDLAANASPNKRRMEILFPYAFCSDFGDSNGA